jgi:hypothetical protein
VTGTADGATGRSKGLLWDVEKGLYLRDEASIDDLV